jgi:hypothetical protein
MNKIASLLAASLWVAASAAFAQINLPNPQLPGSTPHNPVRLVSTSDLMVDSAVRRWLNQHYPGWTADALEFREIGFARFAVVNISAPNQADRQVYFKLATQQNDDDAQDGFPRL